VNRLYETCAGLHTIVEPSEYPYKDGAGALLQACSNIDITDAGKIKRRDGVGLVFAKYSGNCHSAFNAAERWMVFVDGDALSVMDRGGEVFRLRTVTPGAPMRCALQPQGVFHTNGVEHGYIDNDMVARPWTPPADDDAWLISKQYDQPPAGHILGTFGGSLLLGYQDFIFKSREFNPFVFNFSEDYLPILSPARMVREVTGGLWVSNQESISFYSGADFLDLDPIEKYHRPAVSGTDVYVNQQDVIKDLPTGIGIMVTAEDAVLLLTADGSCIDRSSDKITIPPGVTGTAMLRRNQYLVNLTF